MPRKNDKFLVSVFQMQCQTGPKALVANLEKAKHYVKQAAAKGAAMNCLPHRVPANFQFEVLP